MIAGSYLEKTLFVKVDRLIKRISSREILYLTCEGNVSQIHLVGGGAMTCTRLLKLFEEDLAGAGFCRVNHNCLVNLEKVEEIHYIDARKRQLILTGGVVTDISYRKWKAVKSALLGK